MARVPCNAASCQCPGTSLSQRSISQRIALDWWFPLCWDTPGVLKICLQWMALGRFPEAAFSCLFFSVVQECCAGVRGWEKKRWKPDHSPVPIRRINQFQDTAGDGVVSVLCERPAKPCHAVFQQDMEGPQNGWEWQGPLEIISSTFLLKAVSATTGCSGPLLRTMPSLFLSISKDGDPTDSLGNLFQCLSFMI